MLHRLIVREIELPIVQFGKRAFQLVALAPDLGQFDQRVQPFQFESTLSRLLSQQAL
jgi:hypothetical protein